MEFIRRNTKILFVFFLPVYLYIVQNSIQNEHTHVYANGISVIHSHPVSNEGDVPLSKHEHSKTEICLFSSLHFDFYEAPVFADLKVILCESHKNYCIENEQVDTFSPFLIIVPRGPPA